MFAATWPNKSRIDALPQSGIREDSTHIHIVFNAFPDRKANLSQSAAIGKMAGMIKRPLPRSL
jgi:hypothetical protein